MNKVTPLEKYPLPKVEEMFSKLQGATVYSQLDLRNAYNHLPLEENSRKYLALNTHKGLLVPTRLGYGYASAPAIFQRYMETLLAGITGVGVFLDDVMVSGKTPQEHRKALEEVLRRLSDANLRLQMKKCRFGVSSITYLGHHISADGVRPTGDKVSAVKHAPAPKNLKELQAWLGLINYYSKFVRNLSTVLAPLYRLLKKGEPWCWGQDQEKAFQAGKDLLQSSQVLAHFDETAPIILSCDASPYGIGCVLSLVDRQLGERPVAFYSRSLTETQKRYSQTDREGLAIIAGVRRLHHLLAGRDFVIRTDHKPLLGMLGENKPLPLMASPRVTRWAMLLSSYQYRLEYVPGSKQGHCDGLSRLPLPTGSGDLPTPGEAVHLVQFMDASPVTTAMVRLSTERDPTLSTVLRYTRDGWPDDVSGASPELSAYRTKQSEFSIQSGCLLWGARVVIPVKLRERILQMLHEGHLGESHTKSFARMYVWWPNIDVDIALMVKACASCQQYRQQAPVTPLSPWALPSRPYERVHIDYCGLVNGHMLLIVVDAYTKWIDVYVTTRATSETTIDELRKSFACWGIPKYLVSDNAQCFVAPAFQTFCAQNGITHLRTAPLSPKSNGLAERAVQTVKQGLRKQTSGTLHNKLSRFLFSYRSSPHSTTGLTPAELMTGRRMRTRLDCMLPSLQDRVVQSQWKMKELYDKKAQDRNVLPGMSVLVSQVAGLAGVDRATRWLPGWCVSVSGKKLTIKLEDGRVIQRHLDQVVPRVEQQGQRDRPADWTAAPLPVLQPQTEAPSAVLQPPTEAPSAVVCGEREQTPPPEKSGEVRLTPRRRESRAADVPSEVVHQPVESQSEPRMPVQSQREPRVSRNKSAKMPLAQPSSPKTMPYNLRPRK